MIFRFLSGLLVATTLCFLPSTFVGQEKKEVAKTKPIEIPTPPKVFDKKDPDSISDLREIETHTGELVKRLTPCVVNLRIGGSEGSGVVVSEDGLILTAGHVSGQSGLLAIVSFPDGKQYRGITLGNNSDLDSGMVKITEPPGPFPYAEMGKASDLNKGEWVLTLGHPNGMKKDRPPVVRVSRVLNTTKNTITTGCYLVGGDSGGPLFDMRGKVIGIHSRIGENINENVHVPIEVFRDGWEKLRVGTNEGRSFIPQSQRGYLGAELELRSASEELAIASIEKDSPAEKGGLKVGDIVQKFDEKEITSIPEFRRALIRRKPGDEIKLEVKRGSKSMILTIKLSKNPFPKSKRD